MCQRFVAKAELVNRTFSKEVSLKHDQHCSTLFILQLLHNYSHSRLLDYVQQIQFTYTKRKLNNYYSFTSVLKASRKTNTHNDNKSRSRHKDPNYIVALL